MVAIVEGRYTYQFPPGWTATKYDQDRFYIKQFQRIGLVDVGSQGMKAVDVLAFGDGSELWLIEQKDYTGGGAQIKAGELLTAMADKVVGTLACLVAARTNGQNGSASQLLADQALKKTKIRCVLHVEQPTKPSKLFPLVIDPKTGRDKLRRALGAIDSHAELGDQTSLNAKSFSWSIV